MILSLLVGCNADLAVLDDTAYAGYPALTAVSVECDPADNSFRVQARTVGWSERSVVQIWAATGDTATDVPALAGPAGLEASIDEAGFRADEWCDFREANLVATDDETLECTGTFAFGYTALIRVTYEKGCAGEEAVGRYADVLESGFAVEDETDIDDVCPPPGDPGWADTKPQPPTMELEPLAEVPDCNESL